MSKAPWTDEENDLIVADYFAMLADDIAGRRPSKAEHRRALLNDRPEGSLNSRGEDRTSMKRVPVGSRPVDIDDR